jgi:hypothetical protein
MRSSLYGSYQSASSYPQARAILRDRCDPLPPWQWVIEMYGSGPADLRGRIPMGAKRGAYVGRDRPEGRRTALHVATTA